MPLHRVLVLLVFAALPASASAQAWTDAYQAGNYDKAADLLQQIAVESIQDIASASPEPFRQLALMYADGRGVSRNAITACALANMAGQATMMTAPFRYSGDIVAYKAAIKDSEELIHTHCEPLSQDDGLAARRSVGCFAFGMPEETVSVAGRSVRIGRRGISLAGTAATTLTDGEPWDLFGCPQLVAGVRTTSLAPPDDAAPGVGARHFIELFSWTLAAKDGAPVYVLRWDVYEVAGQRIHFLPGVDDFLTRPSWPGPGLPAAVEKGLALEMIRSGHVRWKLEGSPPKRGWLMIGEGVQR